MFAAHGSVPGLDTSVGGVVICITLRGMKMSIFLSKASLVLFVLPPSPTRVHSGTDLLNAR